MARISIDIQKGEVQKEDTECIIGIDLGTTNSLVAFINSAGEPQVVKSRHGRVLVPSVASFELSGNIQVGDEAVKKLEDDPANTIYSVKRLLGKSFSDVENFNTQLSYQIIDDGPENLVKVKAGNKFFSPIEISAEILKELKKMVEDNLKKEVSKAVITVPAYFNDAQRQATRDAGKLAGLDVLRIVNEPTAASLAYGLGSKEDQLIAVYDLGGGTFDISILHIQDGVFEVLSTNGDTFLGGDDFDVAIVNYWLEQFEEDEKPPFSKLRLLAESAKKWLTQNEFFETTISGNRLLSLSKSKLEDIIRHLVEKTINCCAAALRDAKVSKDQLNHVVMVGGSTRVPIVKSEVSKFFGKPVFDDINPDEVVAIGAAVQADILAGNNKDMLLLDITPLSLGIETVGGLMDTIIPRNSKVPTKSGRHYTTSVDGQKNLKIAVYQGERDLVADNRKLGEFILRGIPPMPAGLPKIEVHFILNADGILRVKAKELRSGLEQAIDIKPTYGISEEQMGRMLLDSIQHAKGDMDKRALQEAINEANYLLLASSKFIVQNEAILSSQEIRSIKELTTLLEEFVKNGTKDEIQEAIKNLNDYTAPLAHRAMDNTILSAMKGKQIEPTS